MDVEKIVCEKRVYTKNSSSHSHGNSQLILPLKGKLNLDTDNYKLNINEEKVFYIPPHKKHRFYAKGNNKFIVLDIPEKLNLHLIGESENTVLKEMDNRWKALRSLLYEETKKNNQRNLNSLVHYIANILNEEVSKSIKYIKDHYHEQLTVKKLAQIENYNVSYYNEWFYKKTGMTPNVYIQKIRLEEAKRYLRETDMNILLVAKMVGYKHHSSLTRLFKNNGEILPKEYRKNFRT